MSTRGAPGAAFVIDLQGLESVLQDIQYLDADIRRLVNKPLRQDAKRIAETARPLVESLVRRGPAPQSRAMAATVRARADRMPVIAVGAVNPRLSGFKRGGQARRYKGSIAWGVEKGPAGGPRRHSRGGPRRRSNVYRIARSSRGYVIGPNMERIADAVVPAYADVLVSAMDRATTLNRIYGRR